MQKERDALLAEKEAWTKSDAPSTAEGTPSGSWEKEKAQILAEKEQIKHQLKERYKTIVSGSCLLFLYYPLKPPF